MDQGRSASLLIQAARERNASVLLIDSWESVLVDNFTKVQELVNALGYAPVGIIRSASVAAAGQLDFPDGFDLIHIDANHYAPNPEQDCAAWLPKLKSGGIACFHDYDSCFPDINPAIDKHTAGWADLGVHDGLAIRRKP